MTKKEIQELALKKYLEIQEPDLTEKERRISLTEEFIGRLEGIQADLKNNINLIAEYEKINIFIEHYQDYIKEQKLNSEKADD